MTEDNQLNQKIWQLINNHWYYSYEFNAQFCIKDSSLRTLVSMYLGCAVGEIMFIISDECGSAEEEKHYRHYSHLALNFIGSKIQHLTGVELRKQCIQVLQSVIHCLAR